MFYTVSHTLSIFFLPSNASYAGWDLAAKEALNVFLRREVLDWDDEQMKFARSAKDGSAVRKAISSRWTFFDLGSFLRRWWRGAIDEVSPFRYTVMGGALRTNVPRKIGVSNFGFFGGGFNFWCTLVPNNQRSVVRLFLFVDGDHLFLDTSCFIQYYLAREMLLFVLRQIDRLECFLREGCFGVFQDVCKDVELGHVGITLILMFMLDGWEKSDRAPKD